MKSEIETLRSEKTLLPVPMVSVSIPETLPAAPVQAPAPAKKLPVEKEIHRQALGFYFALGKDRTLKAVAEHFGVKEATVEKWSSLFSWKEKVTKWESRSRSDKFKDQAGDILLLLLSSLTKPDETGAPVFTGSVKGTAEVIKLATSAFKELRQDAREGEPDPDNPGEGKGGKNGAPRVMVNLIFTGLEDDTKGR